MVRVAPSEGVSHRRAGRLITIGAAAGLLLTGCGGGDTNASADANIGGNAAYDPVIAQAQAAFGTSMISGSATADTLNITLVTGAGTGMAKLFLCSNVEGYLKAAGLGSSKVLIVDQTGVTLATEADCR
jgi:hypothetical protein